MPAAWPHTFTDGAGNTASGEEVMDNLDYVYDIAVAGGGATVPGGPGTSLPGSPSNGDEYLYVGEATLGVVWHLKYDSGSGKWRCIGGPPIFKEVTASVNTAATSYGALSGSAGPSVIVPKSGTYIVTIGCAGADLDASVGECRMSYDIGGTGAVDADAVKPSLEGASHARARLKTLGAVTLTAKYRVGATVDVPSPSGSFLERWMSVQPVTIG